MRMDVSLGWPQDGERYPIGFFPTLPRATRSADASSVCGCQDEVESDLRPINALREAVL